MNIVNLILGILGSLSVIIIFLKWLLKKIKDSSKKGISNDFYYKKVAMIARYDISKPKNYDGVREVTIVSKKDNFKFHRIGHGPKDKYNFQISVKSGPVTLQKIGPEGPLNLYDYYNVVFDSPLKKGEELSYCLYDQSTILDETFATDAAYITDKRLDLLVIEVYFEKIMNCNFFYRISDTVGNIIFEEKLFQDTIKLCVSKTKEDCKPSYLHAIEWENCS